MRPKDGAVRAGRIGNRIRALSHVSLSAPAKTVGQSVTVRSFRVRYRGAAAVARNGQRESVTTLPASSGDGLYVALNEGRVAQRASSVVRPQNSAVRERGIVHRVWRCRTSASAPHQNRGRFGDGRDPRIDNMPQLPLPVMVNVRMTLVLASAATGLYVTPNVFEFVNVPAPLCVQGWCRSCWSHR